MGMESRTNNDMHMADMPDEDEDEDEDESSSCSSSRQLTSSAVAECGGAKEREGAIQGEGL